MEINQNVPKSGTPEQSKEKRKGTGEQYLYALLKCAEWVKEPYKQIAEKNRSSPEILKELYLCACDEIPMEKVAEAINKKHPEEALRFVRVKNLKDAAMYEYQKELTEIKETTDALESEVRQMSGILRHIAEHVPEFDAMFPMENENEEDVPESGTENEEKNVPESGTVNEEKNVPESGTVKRGIRIFKSRKKNPAEFIEKSLNAGYTPEQLEYLLDCIEEGIPMELIEKFSSPKLPVEVMKRLRKIEERKEK